LRGIDEFESHLGSGLPANHAEALLNGLTFDRDIVDLSDQKPRAQAG
jgi:hypothetical protein